MLFQAQYLFFVVCAERFLCPNSCILAFAGGTVILSANDVILATANGWFPPSFFGVTLPTSLTAYSVVGATHAVDAQTGWSAAPPGTTGAAFCAPQSPNGAGSWYVSYEYLYLYNAPVKTTAQRCTAQYVFPDDSSPESHGFVDMYFPTPQNYSLLPYQRARLHTCAGILRWAVTR